MLSSLGQTSFSVTYCAKEITERLDMRHLKNPFLPVGLAGALGGMTGKSEDFFGWRISEFFCDTYIWQEFLCKRSAQQADVDSLLSTVSCSAILKYALALGDPWLPQTALTEAVQRRLSTMHLCWCCF